MTRTTLRFAPPIDPDAMQTARQALAGVMIPEPKLGGTFLYCPWQERVTHGGRVDVTWCPRKFRSLSDYRRHWHRWHA